MSVRSTRKTMRDAVDALHVHAGFLTIENGSYKSEPTEKMIAAINTAIIDCKIALREHDEAHDPAAITPVDPLRIGTVQIRRSSESQKFKAADVAKILEEGKTKP